ncbi:MAG: RdgB/HAM1 family non-canonical purine NTP pyrophosphatase [Ruminococcaceae bacterium]|nr:RdgB/HAM1 family non-canonical purine NTP pyrophosphatase [Oscillospiraceae bacterium]
MKIVLASRNQKKIEELRTLLSEEFSDMEILSLDDVGILEDIEENGTTFEENALIKARVAAKSGYVGVADDSGLSVDALAGEPGVYSARYAARCDFAGDHDDEGNNQCLLYNLRDVADEDRTGAYVCAVACVLPDGREFTVRGESRGRILREYRGTGGFGYDPLFYFDAFGKTFAEVSAAEKHSVSHRGAAIRNFAKKLKELI